MPIAGADVWLARLDIDDIHIRNCAELLSPDEHQRAVHFRIERDRKRYIAGRAFMRTLLARYLDRSPRDLRFETGRFGKPALAGLTTPVHFNLSHAEERAVFAISRTYELGVDIETLRRELDHDALAQRFLSVAEYAELQLATEAQRNHVFLRAWTCKEAVAKAMGLGLRARFVEIEISGAAGPQPQLANVPTQDVAKWQLHPVDAGPGYVSTIALRRLGP